MPTTNRGGRRRRGHMVETYTFIALLIGLAIFALPKLARERTRARVARSRADIRQIGAAIKAYTVDHHVAPPSLIALTAPTSYTATIPTDRFAPEAKSGAHPPFRYYRAEKGWIIWGAGPDRDYDIDTQFLETETDLIAVPTRPRVLHLLIAAYAYDPTNGTKSSGDLWRIEGPGRLQRFR